jgi:hypothetical protein
MDLFGMFEPQVQFVKVSVATWIQREQISKTVETISCEKTLGEIFESEGSKKGHDTCGVTRLDHWW